MLASPRSLAVLAGLALLAPFARPALTQQSVVTAAGGPVINMAFYGLLPGVGFSDPTAIAYDQNGNLLILDCSRLYRIRYSAPFTTTFIAQLAGNGAGCEPGFNGDPGDGGPPLQASINGGLGMAADSAGDVFFTDNGSNEVRELSASTGVIEPVPGSASAGLKYPWGLAMDASGNLFVADSSNQRVVELSPSGTVTTVASVCGPEAISLDGNGHLLVVGCNASARSEVVYQLTLATGALNLVVGGGTAAPAAGLAASGVKLGEIGGVYGDASGDIYFASGPNGARNIVYEVPAGSGVLQIVAGGGAVEQTSGPATASDLRVVHAIIADPSGGLDIDAGNNIVRVASGTLSFLAGAGRIGLLNPVPVSGPVSGPPTHFLPLNSIISPSYLDASNGLVLSDYDSGDLLSLSSGALSLVGSGGDGGGPVVRDAAGDIFTTPAGSFAAPPLAQPNTVVEISGATGQATTIAGNGSSGYSGDGGAATGAEFESIDALALDAHGDLFIADAGASVVREVNAQTGIVSTVAGNGTQGEVGDGGVATSAELNEPDAVAVDAQGNLYIADFDLGLGAAVPPSVPFNPPVADGVIRRVDAQTGIITTVAGTPDDANGNPPNLPLGYGDGGPATSAGLSQPEGLAIDPTGNLYIADFGDAKVREVIAATGVIETLAGNGQGGVTGDGGPPADAELRPCGVSFDPQGNLYVADCDAGRVREILDAVGAPQADPASLDFGPQLIGSPSASQSITLTNPGLAPVAITAIAASGDFAETNDCSILTAGATCAVNVTFIPAAAGSRSGSLSVTSNALAAPQSFALSGTGAVDASASVSASSLSFSSQPQGSASAAQTIILTNFGGLPLAINSIAATGPFTQTNDCGSSLAAGVSCTISVSFSPLDVGNAAGSLVISDGAANSPQTITLSGAATAGPIATFAPAALSFYNQPEGVSSPAQAIFFANTGSASLAISGIQASGDFSATNNCPATLAPGANCVISVVFTPTAPGRRAGVLTVADNAPNSPQSVALAGSGPVSQPIITTLAGGEPMGAPSTSVSPPAIFGLGYDPEDDLVIDGCSQIYRLDANRDITTIAGTGAGCYLDSTGDPGNGGPALAASINGAPGMYVDAAGNIIFSDIGSNQVREINASTGVVTAIAGTGVAGYSGDGGPAAQAELNAPWGLAVDPVGNIFVVDHADGSIREISAATGNISTIAQVPEKPGWLALDGAGHLYVSTWAGFGLSDSIIRIDLATGAESAIAGGGTAAPAGGIPALSAGFEIIRGLSADAAGDVFFYGVGAYNPQTRSNSAQPAIYEVKAGTSTLTLLAGGGSGAVPSSFPAPAVGASIGVTSAILPEPDGSLLFDMGYDVVSLANGTLNLVAAFGSEAPDGTPALAIGVDPLAVSASHGLSFVDSSLGSLIRNVNPNNGTLGTLTTAQIQSSAASAYDIARDVQGDLFIANTTYNACNITELTGSTLTVVAGNGTCGSSGDGGAATSAEFDPYAIALDAQGDLYIVDGWNNTIRRVDATTHVITTIAGNPNASGGTGDGGPATSAGFWYPFGIAVDAQGDIYVADQGASGAYEQGFGTDGVIRRIDAQTGIITTVAGTPDDASGNPPSVAMGSGDGGPAGQAALSWPEGLAFDAAGNLYISDYGDAKVREVLATSGAITANSTIITIAGNGQGGVSGDGGPATSAELRPGDVSLDPQGNLYIADYGDGRIREVFDAAGLPQAEPGAVNFGPQLLNAASAAQSVTITNPGINPLAISAVTPSGPFTETDNCVTTLPAGASCTVNVVFTPTAVGPASGSLQVASALAPVSVALSGSGAVPSATLSSPALTFGSQLVGLTSVPQTLTLSNSSAVPLTIASIAASGPFAAANTCGSSLAAGASCTIMVTFAPIAAGAAAGAVTLTDNAPDSPQSVSLSGTGMAVATGSTWAVTGSMTVPRAGATATLLQSGKVLIAGGFNATGVLASAELFDPATGVFTPTGSMTTPRTGQTATLLQNGTVLVAGGGNGSAVLASAEIYDPVAGTFTATGNMTTPRSVATATLLSDGEVLIAGGTPGPSGQPTATATAELYDPATGAFTATGSMQASSNGAVAVLLTNGQVLVTGGFPGGFGITPLSESELYNPATGSFSATGSMNTPRYGLTALTLLPNGQVLVAGGADSTLQGSDLASAELYDPTSGTWTATGSMAAAASNRMPVALSDGEVLVAGGNLVGNPSVLSGAELYDPATGAFAATGSMDVARFQAAFTLLPNGEVLVAGGENYPGGTPNFLSEAELYGSAAAVSPTSLAFASQTVGTTSAAQTLTLTNFSAAALSISSIAASGPFAETNNCGASLAAGASCQIAVTFAPTAAGPATGSLQVASAFSPITVALSGTGAAPPCGPDVTSSVSLARSGLSYSFPLHLYGQTITITNNGAPLPAGATLALDALPAGVSLVNAVGSTLCGSSVASPYVTISQPLATGGSVKVPLQFSDPSRAPITYTLRLLATAIAPPPS